jgi:sulfide:quinone oxidoreductase
MVALRELAGELVDVTILAPDAEFSYRPLSVAEPFDLGEARRFELPKLAALAGATLVHGALAAVDADRRQARTAAGGVIPFDALLLATGAEPQAAIGGALTFRGPADVLKIQQLLAEIEAGAARQVVFAAPAGAVWSLPLYELALMTAGWLAERRISGVELSLVTPEDEPLQLFGPEASSAVRELLDKRGVAVRTRAYPVEVRDGELLLVPDRSVPADRVVALPRLRGRRIDGVPQTIDGFVPVDPHGRVLGLLSVYAAGDLTTFPVKQGGIAAQQAEVAAEAIAAEAGADVTPRPFRPVLRGLLLTGARPRYLRHEVTGGVGDNSVVSPEPLWWPPAKIVGRHLAPFLGALIGSEATAGAPSELGHVSVEVELDDQTLERVSRHRDHLIAEAVGDALHDASAARVGDVMSDAIVVAPEDTLGEVAEKMQSRDFGSALVADHGRLIGILTSRDLLRAFAGRVHSSEARVREWMTADPLVVTAETTLELAALTMSEHGIHHLPVVVGERPVGMVGLRAVLRPARAFAGERLGFGLGV